MLPVYWLYRGNTLYSSERQFHTAIINTAVKNAYLSNIHHGFWQNKITQYKKQDSGKEADKQKTDVKGCKP